MFSTWFESGGPVMYAVLVAWIFVLAGVFDRFAYVAGALVRRPGRRAAALARSGRRRDASRLLRDERSRAELGLDRIDAISRLATSVGLFGTVLGLAQAFFVRTDELQLAAPEVLAGGLATALFTTIGGLIVFLCGQVFLIAFGEWRGACDSAYDRMTREGCGAATSAGEGAS